MANKETCVAYYRVSSDQQVAKGSIARQDQLIPSLIKQRGLKALAEYRDAGVSGKKIETRAGFGRMLKELPRLRPDFIVFLRADRFGRPEDWATLMQLVNAAPTHKVHLLYLREDSLTGELQTQVVHYDNPVELYTFQGEILRAGEENKRRGRDSRMGNFSNLVRGRWPFGQRPYGWRYDRTAHRFVAVPEQIEVIRFVYEQLAAGVGTPSIAAELRRRKVSLPRAADAKMLKKLKDRWPGGEYRWDQSAIRRLAEREYHYTGVYRFDVGGRYPELLAAYRQGRTGVDGQSALTADGVVEFALLAPDGRSAVSKETWRKARAYVDQRAKRHGGQARKVGESFLFGPWLRCECGGNIRASTHRLVNPKKGLTAYRYYACRFHACDSDRDGRPACSTPRLHADAIDVRLWEMLLDWVAQPSVLINHWLRTEKAESGPPDKLAKDLEAKRQQRGDHTKRRERLLELYTDGTLGKVELSRRLAVEDEALQRVEGEIAALERRLQAAVDDTAAVDAARQGVREYENIMSSAAGAVRAALNGLGWTERRAFVKQILGTNEIVLGWRPVATIRSIVKRRAGSGDVKRAADEFIARWCVQPPKADESEGLFVVGVMLPVVPAKLAEALTTAGVAPKAFLHKKLALMKPCD